MGFLVFDLFHNRFAALCHVQVPRVQLDETIAFVATCTIRGPYQARKDAMEKIKKLFDGSGGEKSASGSGKYKCLRHTHYQESKDSKFLPDMLCRKDQIVQGNKSDGFIELDPWYLN